MTSERNRAVVLMRWVGGAACLFKRCLGAQAALLVAGCGTSSYQMVKPEAAKPVAPLELKANADGLELTTTGLIIYKGPGSWKRSAYWDEYIVTLANQGSTPIEINALTLRDVLDREVTAGADPWELEKAGLKQMEFLNRISNRVVPGYLALTPMAPLTAGDVVVGGALAVGLVALIPVAIVTTAYVAPVAAVAYAPAYLVNKLSVDPKNRELVLAEFNRRRLQTPLTLEPGASASGSVFFPLTPGPEQLSAHGRSGEVPLEVAVALPGLKGLHFMHVPDKAALIAAKSK